MAGTGEEKIWKDVKGQSILGGFGVRIDRIRQPFFKIFVVMIVFL